MGGKSKKKATAAFVGRRPVGVAYQTAMGRMYHGRTEILALNGALDRFAGRIQLIFTSPPFPLNRKKKYGNLSGNEYVYWLASFGPLFKRMLTKDGSIVIELGNSWQRGSPTMSTLAEESFLTFVKSNDLNLCQEFIWYNPAKLPTPAQWVNVERIRLKDTFTKLWWISATDRPKADNRRVLKEYSSSMKALLQNGSYNSGPRPSEHNIGEKSFLADNGGAIPGNVLIVANTQSADVYQRYCKRNRIGPHPARMPSDIASFFIRFLTDKGDIVFDPFAGSNTTGAAAEALGRRWLSVEPSKDYIKGSKARFANVNIK